MILCYYEVRKMDVKKLKNELESAVMAMIAEWESENHLKALYVFEVLEFELITEDTKEP